MATVLWFGGILNFVDPLLGLQLYKWSWVLLTILAGTIWLAYRYAKWEAFKPLWGMYYAYKAGSKAAFIFNRRMHAELLSERDAKCIFDYSKWEYEGVGNWFKRKLFYYPTAFLDIDFAHALLYKFGGVNKDVEIARKLQNNEWDDSPSVHSGGIRIDIILDADSWSVPNSPQHKIVEATAESWNAANPKDQIHSYSKFARYILEKKMVCPEGIHPVEEVSWPRMDAGCPIDIEDNVMAGARRQEAKDQEEQENSPFSKFYLPMAAGGLAFAALLLIIRFAYAMVMATPHVP